MYSIYLLVEGKSTEPKLYPNWLRWLLPGYTQVDTPSDAGDHHFYLISGEGYPRLLTDTLPDAIDDVNDNPNFRYFLICLDSDELSVDERREEVQEYLAEHRLKHAEVHIIVQNRCIETWLLGNRQIYPSNPHRDEDCIRFCRHYDVAALDPEAMPLHHDFRWHSHFHAAYLKAVFKERTFVGYRKHQPGQSVERHYLDELLNRIQASPGQLGSFAEFVALCQCIPLPPVPETAA